MIEYEEEWRVIPELGGLYLASNKGRIKSLQRFIFKPHSKTKKIVRYCYKSKILRCSSKKYGHLYVRYGIDGVKYSEHVGRLVLMAWVGPPKEGEECCHSDGDPKNNRPCNLRWDTHANNNKDRLKHGRYAKGEDHHFNKFSDEVIEKIKRGEITRPEALNDIGISATHYYRILKCKAN